MKIALIGAPGSGKTVLAARLYAEFLEQGVASARLVSEYAADHLGMGRYIKTLLDQTDIIEEQIKREEHAERCNFNPIICDTAIWQGAIYLGRMDFPTKDKRRAGEYMEKISKYISSYDLTIFTPLYNNEDNLNKFRIHNAAQAGRIEIELKQAIVNAGWVVEAPRQLSERAGFVKKVVAEFMMKEAQCK